MFSLNRKHLAVGSCSLVLGILIGIAIDLALRPNHIILWVDGNNDTREIRVAPQPGDIVEWNALDESKGDINVTFYGDNPCIGKPVNANPCITDAIPAGASYLYGCVAQNDPNYACPDPGHAPKSSTNPTRFTAKVKEFFKEFFQNLAELFQAIPFKLRNFSRDLFSRGTSAMPEVSTTNTSLGNVMNSTKANSQESKPLVNFTTMRANIHCDSNNAVAVTPFGRHENDPINANNGQVIAWTSSSGGSFSVAMSVASSCTPLGGEAPAAMTKCTAVTSGTYTATNYACHTQTGTFNIQVP
jgi:hypothetical protein